jgi:hypothetical protein
MAVWPQWFVESITRLPLRGQHRTCSIRTYRFPVSPHARRHGTPETGRHLNIRKTVRQLLRTFGNYYGDPRNFMVSVKASF